MKSFFFILKNNNKYTYFYTFLWKMNFKNIRKIKKNRNMFTSFPILKIVWELYFIPLPFSLPSSSCPNTLLLPYKVWEIVNQKDRALFIHTCIYIGYSVFVGVWDVDGKRVSKSGRGLGHRRKKCGRVGKPIRWIEKPTLFSSSFDVTFLDVTWYVGWWFLSLTNHVRLRGPFLTFFFLFLTYPTRLFEASTLSVYIFFFFKFWVDFYFFIFCLCRIFLMGMTLVLFALLLIWVIYLFVLLSWLIQKLWYEHWLMPNSSKSLCPFAIIYFLALTCLCFTRTCLFQEGESKISCLEDREFVSAAKNFGFFYQLIWTVK